MRTTCQAGDGSLMEWDGTQSQDGGKIKMEVKMDSNQMENLLQKLSG